MTSASLPELDSALAALSSNPDDAEALALLTSLAQPGNAAVARALADAVRVHRERGDFELCVRLLDLGAATERDDGRRADLVFDKGRILADELLRDDEATKAFERVLELRPDDETAEDALGHIALVRDNWQKILRKYLDEAKSSTDRQLTASLYLSVAELHARFQPDAGVEQFLRKALEVDPRNQKASLRLERLYRAESRWEELGHLYEQRAEAAVTKEDRVLAYLALGELERSHRQRTLEASEADKKVLGIDPMNARALATLVEYYTTTEAWQPLIRVYENALRARPRGEPEVGTLLQIAMIWWKKVGNLEAADEYWKRVRKADPAHPAMLEFYRTYHGGDAGKLLPILQQAQRLSGNEASALDLALETARAAASTRGSAERAIDLWKSVGKLSPGNVEAQAALTSLYESTEKWNALLELHKEALETLNKPPSGSASPDDLVEQKIARLLQMVRVYRDKLAFDQMVVNTYGQILQLRPDHEEALTALTQRYEAQGRWNDLITVLQRRADVATAVSTKAELLRRIASLWIEKFSNLHQAVRPLEELWALDPTDADVVDRLRDLYTRRRAWRSLLDLERKEEERLEQHGTPVERRAKLIEIAKLTAERLGDAKEAIAAWNRLLEVDPNDADALPALASLYEREKRWPALVEILRRQASLVTEARAKVSLLERAANILAERLSQPDRAAEIYKDVLELQPGHPRATRTLQALFAQSGQLDALVDLYARNNQWEELFEVLQQTAERLPGTEGPRRIDILERAAVIARDRLLSQDKAARAYERIVAIDTVRGSATQLAAGALAVIYAAQEKWARLLAIYEVLLGFATTVEEQLARIREIRDLSADRLGSRGLAFSWGARAYALAPTDATLEADLERLADAAETWDELAEIYQREIGADVTPEHRLGRLRRLADIALNHQHKVDDARRYYEQILAQVPGDPGALTALEQLFAEGNSYPQLLAIYRQREATWRGGAADPARVDLLFKIAWIEEEKLDDVDAARRTLERIRSMSPGVPAEIRALRAQERLEQQGGATRTAALAEVLERQLELAEHDDARVELGSRLASLYAGPLEAPQKALAQLERTLALDPDRRATHAALEMLLDSTTRRLDDPDRARTLAMLVPAYDERLKGATGDDVGRTASRLLYLLEQQLITAREPADRLALLTRMAALADDLVTTPALEKRRYDWAAERFEAAPSSRELRHALGILAERADRIDDLAVRLGEAEQRATDPGLKHDLAIELGALFEGPLGMGDEAAAAYRRAIEIDPADPIAEPSLERLYKAGDRYTELRALYVVRKERALDVNRRIEALQSICDLDEGVLDDRDAAIASYRELLDLDPQAVRPFRALERLYTQLERWPELEALLSAREAFQPSPLDRHDVKGTTESRAHFRFRRAELFRDKLSDVSHAVDLYEETVAEEPSHEGARRSLEALMKRPEVRLRVARVLQPVYEADQAWPKLALALGAEREALEGAEAVPLLTRLAGLQEEKLGARQLALATWREALRLDPADRSIRAAVERLAVLLGRHADLAAAWDEAYLASDPNDLPLRAELLTRSARLYEKELRDLQKAAATWRRLFDLDPTNVELGVPAADALARIYEAGEAWAKLVEVLRRRVDWSSTDDERRQLLFRIARIQEELLVDPVAATATYRELLEGDPTDRSALDGLEKLHAAKGEWQDLADVVRRRLELENDGKARRDLLFRLAQLTERELQDPGGAVAAFGAVLEESPDDTPSLEALTRLHEAAGRKVDLLETLDRRIQLELDRPALDSSVIATLRMQAAALDLELGRPESALERYRAVLELDKKHQGALRGLEPLLEDSNLRVRAAEVLEPRYEELGDSARLLAIHELMADASPDLRERVTRLERASDLRTKSGDRDGAFEDLAKAARLSVGEPDLGALLDRLEAAVPRESRGKLVVLYQDLGPDILDATTQERVQLTVAAESARLGDTTTARESYRRVLDASPENVTALAALETIYRADSEWSALYEIYARRAELAGTADGDERRRYLLLGAELAEGALDRPSDAIPAYEEALELQPADLATSKALEARYQAASRWHELAELLERRLGFSDELHEAVALRVQLGRLFDQDLNDAERAVESYRAALGGDPSNAEAIEALERHLEDPTHGPAVAEVLEPVYVARHDWVRLVRVCEIRLEAADDSRARLALRRRIARIYEEQLEDLDGAFTAYTRVYREDPTDRTTRDQLSRLAGVLDGWERLAAMYEDHLETVGADGDGAEDALRALASIYHERLADVDRARGAYGRLLERDRDDEVAFVSLEKLLERASRWRELLDAYREASLNTLDQSMRLRLIHKAAAVAEDKLSDLEVAIELHRSALEIEPNDAKSLSSLERLFQRAERWHDLAELVERRIGDRNTTDAAGWIADKVQLAALRTAHLDDVPGAIDLYEEILGREPAEPRAVRALEKIIVAPEHTYRLAQLLGPIYRAEGSWQKLVVIFEAELGFIDTPTERYERFLELAELHEKSGHDAARAFAAVLRSWREQTALGDDPEARPREDHLAEELERLAAAAQKFPQLVDELETTVADSLDPELRARVYRRVAKLSSQHLADRPRAIVALEQLLASDESDEDAWADLERALAGEERWKDLVASLDRRASIVSDPPLQRTLYDRAAVIHEEQLHDAASAIAAWHKVLDLDSEDAPALAALARLHRSRGEHAQLADTLDRQIAVTSDAIARRGLRGELGALAAGQLADGPRAADAWRAVLAEDARDRDALVELRRVELAAEHYPEALEVTDSLAELATGAARSALRVEAAELVEKQLQDPIEAIERYSAVLADGDAAARAALERLARDRDVRSAAAGVLDPYYERTGEWGALIDLGELMVAADASGEPAERREWLFKMAQAAEKGLRDGKRAFSLWARALGEEPADADARAALERLAEIENIPGELTRAYEELLTGGAVSVQPEVARMLAMRLGELYELRIGDEERAIIAYGKVLDAPEGDVEAERSALLALDRLLSKAGRPRDLAEVLRKRAESADDAVERVVLLHRLGSLYARELVDLDKALEAFRDALEVDPSHAESRIGLEALLGSQPHREAALDVLEPLFERDGNTAKQNQLAEVRLETLDDRPQQGALLERIAERAETLRDPRAAFSAMARALTLDPSAERLADESQRLASLTGQPDQAATLFEKLVADRADLSPDARRSLSLKAGSIWEATGAPDKAEARYQQLLADDREDADALESLERLYRIRGDASRLADILTRRASVEIDADAKKALYAEAAQLAEQSLGDPDGAVELWRKVLEIDDTDSSALAALARLLEQRARWPELADLLARAAEVAGEPRTQAALLGRVAALSAERLDDLPRAIAALRELLDLQPDSMTAIDSLIDLETRRGDKDALKEALERKLAAVSVGPARIPIFRRLAELAAAQDESSATDDALGYLYEILALDPVDAQAGTLQRTLLIRTERWHDLVDVLGAEATRLERIGDTAGELATLVQAADVWEEKLESPESAIELLEKILARDPGNVRALLSLARIAESAGDNDRARTMLAGAEASAKTPSDIAELAYRRARVESESGDPAAAAGHYRRALAANPSHVPALDALIEQLREARDTEQLVPLLETRVALPDTSRELRTELARLYIEKLGTPDRARTHLEALLASDPGKGAEQEQLKLRELLADLHFAAGRFDEARALYQALVEAANQARRRGKDVARLHGRLGQIAERTDDIAGALAAYAESQRLDASHAPTLVALARLQGAKGDWEAARKVYRSLLLQNLDAEAGISKGGVYAALGAIHEKLNEGPKAVGMYERAIELEPANETVRAALARLRSS
ncbi:MAG: tetratricopeptide repeat protein [Polyangia bacterium]